MADRGRAGARRDRRAKGVVPGRARRPDRARREGVGSARARLRRGLSAKSASGAAKVLGMSTTRRAAVVAIVVCALAFTVVVPLRTYLSQRSEVSVQQERRSALEAEVAQLEARKAELADPAQIEAEARRRLRYVMPGETPYMVQLPEDKASDRPATPNQQRVPQGPWYVRLWSQVSSR